MVKVGRKAIIVKMKNNFIIGIVIIGVIVIGGVFIFNDSLKRITDEGNIEGIVDGIIDGEIEFILPINKEDITEMGIGPFGVPIVGSHPFGHPGIDFAMYEDRPIYAMVDGTIMHIGTSTDESDKTFTLRYDSGMDIYYTGSMREIIVENGDRVKQGDLLAYSEFLIREGQKLEWGNLHIGVQDQVKDVSICPANFFTTEAEVIAQELLDRTEYQNKNEYPLLCNPCGEGGCR